MELKLAVTMASIFPPVLSPHPLISILKWIFLVWFCLGAEGHKELCPGLGPVSVPRGHSCRGLGTIWGPRGLNGGWPHETQAPCPLNDLSGPKVEFLKLSSKCIHTFSTSQIRLAVFPVLSHHLWLVAPFLELLQNQLVFRSI